MAATQATNQYAKQFAGFELAETNGMLNVLNDMGTTSPPPDAKARAMMTQIGS